MSRRIDSFYSRIACSPNSDRMLSLLGIKGLWARFRVLHAKKMHLSIAKKLFERGSGIGPFEDYKRALHKHWVSYDEYVQYDFPHKTEQERDEFVARLKLLYFFWKYVPEFTKPLFHDKQQFLRFFSNYIHRQWLFAPDASYEEFRALISAHDCIVKPCDEMRGRGIYRICKDEVSDSRELYESCVKARMLVEQCVESCEDLKAFHPQSLNTIRVVTISNTEKAEVFGSFFRMGVGNSIVDNAHAGGIFAQINVDDGVIISEGINTRGERFISHPDSGLKIKGFKIPKWDLICETCCEAAKLTENTITGWDVTINNQGQVEFVEGNNRSDFDVMQSPLQVGVKRRIFALIKEYRGIELK